MISRLRKIRVRPRESLNKIRSDLWIWQKELEPPVAPLYIRAGVDELPKIEAKLAAIKTSDKVKEVLEYCEHFYEIEEKRREQTENKATILAGFAGTATAGLLAFLNIFLDTLSHVHWVIRALGIGLSTLSLTSLVFSILFSVIALTVRGYHFPKPMKVFDLAEKPLEDVWKRRAAEYFYAYVKNQAIDDRKVEAYKYATRSFQWAIYLVIPLMLMIFGFSVSDSLESLNLTPTSTPTAVTATSSATITLTASPTPSATFIPSPSPTLTTAPSFTATPSPAPTQTPTIQPTQPQNP